MIITIGYRTPLLFLLVCACIQFDGKAQSTSAADSVDLSLFETMTYRMPGPHRGGRVTAVSGFGGRKPTLYMGSTGGGVWKSTNNGLSYTNVSDGYFSVGSIGSLAVAPGDSNVVYAGTGSACIRSNVSTGKGVYKSLDGGESWLYMGLPEAGQIGSMVVHPTDPNLVYAAALGHPFGPNPDRGVYRSYDGGTTWEKVLYVSDSTGAASVVINPQNPDEMYATMWRAERKPWTIISGGTEGGLYKSLDGGTSWSHLTVGLPDSLIGKMDVSLSPANPNRVYVLAEAPGDQAGLYRSDDAGETFRQVNNLPELTFRPFYYTHVHADPVDEDIVYVSNEGFYKSVNGGLAFTRISTPHGDHHALWINPSDPDYLFQGNDGGATVSLDGGQSWSSINNQATAELYHVVVDNQHPYWLYGEQQDNSTIMVPSLPPTASRPLSPKQHWKAAAGCETGPLAVHPEKPHIVYGGCKGRFSRLNQQTGQEQQYWVYPHFNYGHAAEDMPFRFQRTAPIEISPHNPEVIYHASQFVHRTTNEGKNWQVISPDLTAFEPDKQGYSGEPITRDITGEEIYSAIYQVRESPLREGVIWTGSNDGLIYVSQDSGENWTNITPPLVPPGGRVQTIEPSPHSSSTVYAAIYRYMLDDWAPYIVKTSDFGESWTLLTDSTSGFPMDQPTRVVREDPDREGLLYAGTEFGLFVSLDDGTTWQPFQNNLPATPVTDIRIHRKDMVLSTMGRSFWILDDLTPLHEVDSTLFENKAHLFTPRDTYRYRWNASTSQFDGAAPEYPKPGIQLYYYLNEASGEAITLEIKKEQGSVVRTFTTHVDDASPPTPPEDIMGTFFQPPVPEGALTAKKGLNLFTWDLNYQGTLALISNRHETNGPLAEPGTYIATLSVGEQSFVRSFELMLDPRLAQDGVTPADVEAQTLLSLQVRDRISDIRRIGKQIQALRRKVTQVVADADNEAVPSTEGADILEELNRIEGALIQTQKGKVGAQHKPKLMRQLTYLYSMLQVADQSPGEDAYVRLEDIERELNEYVQAFDTLIRNDLSALNIQLEGLGLAPLEIP
ncbi:MAG: glycosyl hydrolase [Rhodothermaceae bacterium]|nr:glycosyl hydrolase [Rhodothermaceae bacterium]